MGKCGEVVKSGSAEAKSDLIGAIYHSVLYELLGFEKVYTSGEQAAWQKLEEELKKLAGTEDGDRTLEKAGNRAQDFGNEREEAGFRKGFHVAMRLCMEGLNGDIR